MLLTITTSHTPATDIGFLLEKHPDKVHDFELSAGRATVFYPEATEQRCTVALPGCEPGSDTIDASESDGCSTDGGRFLYLTDQAAVVITNTGQVVTAWGQQQFLPGVLKVLSVVGAQ